MSSRKGENLFLPWSKLTNVWLPKTRRTRKIETVPFHRSRVYKNPSEQRIRNPLIPCVAQVGNLAQRCVLCWKRGSNVISLLWLTCLKSYSGTRNNPVQFAVSSIPDPFWLPWCVALKKLGISLPVPGYNIHSLRSRAVVRYKLLCRRNRAFYCTSRPC